METTIKDQVVIMLETYNLRDWQNALIQRCIDDNPNQPVTYIAKLLGVATRTITRKANQAKVRIKRNERYKTSLELKQDIEIIPKFNANGR